MNEIKKWIPPLRTLPCFYCSADGKELKTILIVMIGGFVLGSIFVLFWSFAVGGFKDVEAVKHDIIENERTRR